jgi:antitoxin (DNA-binding transcriptional repressor) of toxin-antitoxin stability system
LSHPVDKAALGEDVVVSRNGKPMVRITRLDATRRRISFGLLKGRFSVPTDFDAPLPGETIAAFEGRRCGCGWIPMSFSGRWPARRS